MSEEPTPQPDESPSVKKPSRDPLHGVTLEMMITRLVDRHGWEELGRQIPIRCFQYEPSIKSSLVFLARPHGLASVWKTGMPTTLEGN